MGPHLLYTYFEKNQRKKSVIVLLKRGFSKIIKPFFLKNFSQRQPFLLFPYYLMISLNESLFVRAVF